MKIPYISSACQRMDIVGAHRLTERIRGQINHGLGIKSGVKRLLRGGPPPLPPGTMGSPSKFADGAWVRVRNEAAIRATLDENSCCRGLLFCSYQWYTCGRVYRVISSVRRIIDDAGVLRKVSGTVLLEGLDCGGEDGYSGCGRHCPMMYRDEWLEPTESPPLLQEPPAAADGRYARVRSLSEIKSTLDWLGRRDSLMFMPEMARYAGTRVKIQKQIERVFEYSRWLEPRAPTYILEGLYCTGDVLGQNGPCHRACWLLWHADWLELEP